MCGIEQLMCGIPRPGVVSNFLLFSAVAVWVCFAAIIGHYLLKIIATDAAYRFITDAIGGLVAAVVFTYLLQLTRTIYSLNARIIELEADKISVSGEI